jgi:hypothetical protein
LLAELKQTRPALAKAEAGRNSLSVKHGKLEKECASLRAAIDTLGQEKAKATTDHEAALVTEHKKFRDYHIDHHKKLRELQVNLEKAVNENGMRCLPHPGKNSTIDEIVKWFDKEIQALPGVIFKANKNFLCYNLIGVLKMLYESAKELMRCLHLG